MVLMQKYQNTESFEKKQKRLLPMGSRPMMMLFSLFVIMNGSCASVEERPTARVDVETANEIIQEIKVSKPLEAKILKRTISNLELAINDQSQYADGLEKKNRELVKEIQDLRKDADFGRRVKYFIIGILACIVAYLSYRIFKIVRGLRPI